LMICCIKVSIKLLRFVAGAARQSMADERCNLVGSTRP